MTIYDASMRYQAEGTPLLVIAGKEYGSGSSRDWAAKGPMLLGIRATLAESYERIHRSNLVGMGVLPLQFRAGQNAASLGLTGEEVFDINGLADALASGFAQGREIAVRGDPLAIHVTKSGGREPRPRAARLLVGLVRLGQDLDVPVRSMDADSLPIPDQPGRMLHPHDGRQPVLPCDHRAMGHQAPHLRHQALDRDEQRRPAGVRGGGDQDVARFEICLRHVQDDAGAPLDSPGGNW